MWNRNGIARVSGAPSALRWLHSAFKMRRILHRTGNPFHEPQKWIADDQGPVHVEVQGFKERISYGNSHPESLPLGEGSSLPTSRVRNRANPEGIPQQSPGLRAASY